MSGGRRALVAVLVAALVAWPATAGAHGGLLLATSEAGPYHVQVMALAVTRSTDGPKIDYTTYVRDRESGRPVEDAAVSIDVVVDGRDQRLHVQRIGNGYEGIARVPSSSDVQAYPLRVAVRGPAGSTNLRITPPAGDGGPPVPLIAGTVIALTLLVAWTIRRRRVTMR